MEPTKRRTPWWIVAIVLVGVLLLAVGAWVADAEECYLTLHSPPELVFGFVPMSLVGSVFPIEGQWLRLGPIGLRRMNNIPRLPGRRIGVEYPLLWEWVLYSSER